MIGGRATWTIASSALRRAPRAAEGIAVLCATGGAAAASPTAAACFAVVGIAAATVASIGAQRTADVTDLRLFAAPLYGRELARAIVLAPCVRLAVAALVALCTVAVSAAVLHRSLPNDAWGRLAALLAAEIVATLVAMSGCARRGRERSLYVALALVAGAAVAWLGFTATPTALLAAAVAGGTLGFVAVRALGETLARYDPLE